MTRATSSPQFIHAFHDSVEQLARQRCNVEIEQREGMPDVWTGAGLRRKENGFQGTTVLRGAELPIQPPRRDHHLYEHYKSWLINAPHPDQAGIGGADLAKLRHAELDSKFGLRPMGGPSTSDPDKQLPSPQKLIEPPDAE
jgi:hypothetical protein